VIGERLEDRICIDMISNMTGSIDRKVAPFQQRFWASPERWLSLAAAPTFAIMALLTVVGSGPPDLLCSAAQHASPLGGMIPMYLLMSAFHSAPWLKLVSRQRNKARRT
jgi:hypothetical protein